ncbi:MAG: RluA family pseudouridine synthase [Pelagibacteraceae bacterium]|jgi:23S rRNA pseudouridine1911/1915/1917 synthase|nr:RNA pseudouridine synthase [Candidatus Pelagibacter sp.]MDP6680736.1 RluA family pseudouridine synthase [Pelagibacteraceae bacterium]MDP6710287.1 RluA family pseudouridine synthase [Pelagibacteraceae bacterium]|tara:strand:+ start:76 stop:1059 length:984 start_codon:yes stop_codon:yes gene_type:complete
MEKKIFNVSAYIDSLGNRLDKFLQSQLIKISRTKVQSLIRDGYVKLNNITIYEASKKIKNNDKIEINFPPPKEILIKPYKMPLDILFDDDDILVINKPSGVVVHPGAGNYEKTIVNALLFHYKNKLSSVGGKLRPGIVHRIDKDTSGIIVIAKNDNAHINLSKQFSNHTIKRTYETLVWGSLKPKNGKINEKISRSIKNRQLMTVRKEKGKKAITNYKTLEIFYNLNLPKISLVECQLETGRTHQIRVHMNFKGNPILGDKSYGKIKRKFKKIDANIEKKINSFNRQALHAKSLGFMHPGTEKKVFFEVERPKDFDQLVKSLKKASI